MNATSAQQRVSDEELAEIRRQLTDRIDAAVVHLLPKGVRTGGEWRVGSTLGEAGGSLAVQLKGAKAGVWYDHATKETGGPIALWMAARGVDFSTALEEIRAWLGVERPAPKPVRPQQQPIANTTSLAFDIWRETKPLPGTPGDPYLEARGVTYSGDALRWHASCPFGPGVRVGCMVALVRNIITNRPQAIHRTAIDPQGRKISRLGSNGRLSLGPVKGGAVKLTDNAEVERVIAVGEGIETTLSIRRLPDLELMPVWSLLSAQGIASFPALPGIESVWIAADHDVSGTGQRDARKLAQRLSGSGIEAIIVKPDMIATDLNDTIRSARNG